MSQQKQTVAVIGASPKPERYSNRAIRLLVELGHEVIPIHPAIAMVEEIEVLPNVTEIEEYVDTVTLYVSEKLSTPMIEQLVELKPGRVIFNPGTENPALQEALEAHGIPTEEACTLILLNTDQL